MTLTGPTDTTMILLFFKLLIGHAVADFGLANSWMSDAKNRNLPAGRGHWPVVLTAHALIHAGAVFVILPSYPLLALAEFAAHWAIDLMRCDGDFGFYTDQELHILCKVFWVLVVLAVGR